MSMVSSLGRHAVHGAPSVGAESHTLDRRSSRLHHVGVAALLAAAGLAAVLLLQGVSAAVHVGPSVDLTQSQPVVDNRPLANVAAANCDGAGNCLTP